MSRVAPVLKAAVCAALSVVSRFWAIAAVLIAWQMWVRFAGINRILMPTPAMVVESLWDNPTLYLTALRRTLVTAVAGLVLGTTLGTVAAISTWLVPPLRGVLTPTLLIVRSVPMVVMVPIFSRLLGFSTSMVLLVVSLLSFFPAFVLVTSGFAQLSASTQAVPRVLGASRLRELRHIAAPAAIPNFFTALRLSSASSILIAMVAEFLTGLDGLGKVFLLARSDLQSARAWAAAIVAAVASLVLFRLAGLLETRADARMQ